MIGGNGPVIDAGFAVAAAAFGADAALRAGVLRAAGALVRAWARRAAGSVDDAGFGLLDTLLAGVRRAAGAVFFAALANCFAIE